MLLSRLEFCSLLSYTPHPENDVQRKTKDYVYDLKSDKQTGTPSIPITMDIARNIANNISIRFGNLFGSDVILIPVPSSTLKKSEDLWVPYNLAKALESKGLGKVIACVKQKNAIPKSATSRPEDRATAQQHYDSLVIEGVVPAMKRIVLIDDVVTRGATAIGVASRLKDAYPDADIRLFAAVRTMSNAKEFKEFVEPCINGTIRLLQNGQTRRHP